MGSSGATASSPSLLSAAMQLLFVFFALGLVIFLAWLTSRLIATRFGGARRSRNLRVLDQIPIGRDRQLLLVEIAGRVLLVGSTPDQFSLLTTFQDGETVAQLVQGSSAGGTDAGFASLLQRFMKGPGSNFPNADLAATLDEQPRDELGLIGQKIRELRNLTKK